MSTHTINTTETPLKRGLTLKGSLEKLASELHEAVPLVEAGYGYEHDAALCLKEALGEARRMVTAIEAITRLLASSIHHQGCTDREIDRGQGDLFDQAEESYREPLSLPANGVASPTLDRDRTLPGGDAHDSFSQHLIEHEDPPQIKLPFEVEMGGITRRYVTVAMSPGQWVEAVEVLTQDQFEASGLPINLLTNQGLLVRCGAVDYVLGACLRFTARETLDVEYEIIDDAS